MATIALEISSGEAKPTHADTHETSEGAKETDEAPVSSQVLSMEDIVSAIRGLPQTLAISSSMKSLEGGVGGVKGDPAPEGVDKCEGHS